VDLPPPPSDTMTQHGSLTRFELSLPDYFWQYALHRVPLKSPHLIRRRDVLTGQRQHELDDSSIEVGIRGVYLRCVTIEAHPSDGHCLVDESSLPLFCGRGSAAAVVKREHSPPDAELFDELRCQPSWRTRTMRRQHCPGGPGQ